MDYTSESLKNAVLNKTHIRAMVRSVGDRKLGNKKVECAVFQLAEDVKGICPNFEFGEHEFKSLIGFVGTVHDLVILSYDDVEKVAIVSVKQADERKRKQFWDKLKTLENEGEEVLQAAEFKGNITGFNPISNSIFVRVEGQDCFIKANDFDHSRIYNLADVAERNKEIDVRVLRFDEEKKQVQLSRKLAIPDPFEALRQYKLDEAVVGTVSTVHPVHGIFVQLAKGVQIKASKPRDLEPPLVGELVTIRIKNVDYENRKARSVIINYPQGKKKVKDVASFLYD